MFNFNNKIVFQETNYPPRFQHLVGCQQIQMLDIAKREGSATECLLYLSELQQPDKLSAKHSKHNDIDEAEVAPWTNTNFKAKIQMPGKSKTSILLPPCERQMKSNKPKLQNKNKENKENSHYRGKAESREKVRIHKKNSDQIKNSYSAIARYNDCTSDILNFPTRQFSQCKNEAQPIYFKTNFQTNQYSKIVACPQNKSKLCSKIDKQNEALDIVACTVPKIEQNFYNKSITKNMKVYLHEGTSFTGPILKQNTGIINDAVAMRSNNYTNLNNADYLKDKNDNCVSEFNITPYDLQDTTNKINKTETQKKQGHQARPGCQSQFQILCQQQRKAGSQYQKIKKQIMQNIQKQAILRSSMPVQNKNSKKMLGRYFKQMPSKKSKCKIKSNIITSNKTQSSQYSYESSNPLTKHLYQKYRMLINRGK